MKHELNEIVILTASLKGLTKAVNDRRCEVLISILDDLNVPYKRVQGFYNDFNETSFMVQLEHRKGQHENFYRDICINNFDQESILYRDKYKKGFLLFKDKTIEIGTIDRITPDEALNSDGFTWLPESNQYLGVKQ